MDALANHLKELLDLVKLTQTYITRLVFYLVFGRRIVNLFKTISEL